MANNYPFYEIAAAVEQLAAKGWQCFQKFTCANCSNRLTMDKPNVLYKTGTCDVCGHETNIEENGCNYLLVGKNKSAADLLEARKCSESP